MSRKTVLKAVLVFLVSMLFVSTAFAEHLYGPDELDTSYGVYFRFRQETWSNTLDFDNTTTSPVDRNFFRLKTSAWFRNDYAKKYDFFVKLTNEAQYWLHNVGTSSPLLEDEIVFDNLYVGATDIAGLPVSLRVGRQDFLMTHGEGFLIMDGTPLDGSRTFYFNAAKLNVKFGDNWNADLIYITQQTTDRYLPSMYASEKRPLNSSDEQGWVVYGRGKIGESLSLEPYYMYKKEETADELTLNTIGARAVFNAAGFKFRGEYAHQFGEYDTSKRDRTADGGYVFVSRGYKDVKWSPSWELGYVYLSGDDPNSSDDEAWDPLWSRWPWLSELYVFTLIQERGIAYWTNTSWARAGVKLAFTPDTSLDLKYNYIRAVEETGVPGEKEKGHLPQVQLNHKFTDRIDGYLRVEYMIPGDYYAGDDKAAFVRWQLQWKI